ncbi:hypothetical protein AgCh_016889 [Apium graveolens]
MENIGGNFIHYLSTFLAGLVVGFVSAWKPALLSRAVFQELHLLKRCVCVCGGREAVRAMGSGGCGVVMPRRSVRPIRVPAPSGPGSSEIVVVLLIASQFGTSGHGEFSKPVGNASRTMSPRRRGTRAHPAKSVNQQRNEPDPVVNEESEEDLDYNEYDEEDYVEEEAEDTHQGGNPMNEFMELLRANLNQQPIPPQP